MYRGSAFLTSSRRGGTWPGDAGVQGIEERGVFLAIDGCWRLVVSEGGLGLSDLMRRRGLCARPSQAGI